MLCPCPSEVPPWARRAHDRASSGRAIGVRPSCGRVTVDRPRMLGGDESGFSDNTLNGVSSGESLNSPPDAPSMVVAGGGTGGTRAISRALDPGVPGSREATALLRSPAASRRVV